MRLGCALAVGSDSTVDVLRMVSDGISGATVNVPTPTSMTPSTPSFAVTRAVQLPYTGDAGTVYAYCSTQVDEVVRPQPPAAPCAVMDWPVTIVLPPASMMLTAAPEMSKLPNGSLTVARMYSVLPGFHVACCAPVLNACVQVCTLFTLMIVALLSSTRE